MPTTPNKRAYTAGKYGIEIDGHPGGWIQSYEGGHASAEVVQEKIGIDAIIKKHISTVKYEDITINCGTGMSKGFYEWIKASFDHKHERRNGALITADYDFTEITRLSFFNGLISEIGFPALDAGSKDAAKMSIKVAPEYTRMEARPGRKIAGAWKIDQALQKKWLPSNFKLEIAGLDCTRVNKVEALTLKQKIVENPCGEMRDAEKEPAHLEVPNLVVTVAESHAGEWYQWHDDFVIKGNCFDHLEKTGSLTYLTTDLKTNLFTIEFTHLGIFKGTPEKVEAGSENIRRVKFEMYCEEMKFTYHNSSWA